jgi:hypothetical protein
MAMPANRRVALSIPLVERIFSKLFVSVAPPVIDAKQVANNAHVHRPMK